MFDAAARRAIEDVARANKIEPATLLALCWVESAGRPFWKVGGKNVPPIRPEAHYFHKRLAGAKLKRAIAEGLAHPKAGAVKVPKSYTAVYDVLAAMKAIDSAAALESISMGLGQVMGAHWKALGFKSVAEMWALCQAGVAGQVEIIVRYIRWAKMEKMLAARNWAAIAAEWNGPAYRKYRYDTKLANAYATFSNGAGEDPLIKTLQGKLATLGYYTGEVDGDYGKKTKAAVKAFQRDRGLVADGDAGEMTLKEIEEALGERKREKAPRNVGAIAAGGAGTAVAAAKLLPEVPDIVNAIDTSSSAADSVQSIGFAIGLPTIVIGVLVAAAVGALVWYLIRNAQRGEASA